jgi:hypothetical protein
MSFFDRFDTVTATVALPGTGTVFENVLAAVREAGVRWMIFNCRLYDAADPEVQDIDDFVGFHHLAASEKTSSGR